MEAWPQAWGWASLTLLAGIAIGCCIGVVAGFAIAQAVAPRLLARRARRTAVREDRNGRALLRIATDMDRHAATLLVDGESGHVHHQWSRLCRRVAADHLKSINTILLLESYLDLQHTDPQHTDLQHTDLRQDGSHQNPPPDDRGRTGR